MAAVATAAVATAATTAAAGGERGREREKERGREREKERERERERERCQRSKIGWMVICRFLLSIYNYFFTVEQLSEQTCRRDSEFKQGAEPRP